METERSIEIPRPRPAVFSTVLDNLSEWSRTCVEDEVLEDAGDGGPGTTFRVVTDDRGRRMEFTGLVTAHEPPLHSACTLRGTAFDLDVAYEFEEIPAGTRVTQRSLVKPKGLLKVLFFLLRPLMRRQGCAAQRQELEALRAYCEKRIPTAS